MDVRWRDTPVTVTRRGALKTKGKQMKILDIPRSGSYAGTTSSRNRFGQYVRNRRSPVQPIGTGRRAFIRAAFGAASVAWAALTSDQQAAWDSFAEGHPVTNSLGATVVLTGHQMFVAVGTQSQNIGSGLPITPPDTTDTPALSAVTLVADDTPTVTVGFTASTAAASCLIAFSPPLGPGRRFPTRFWQASVASTTGAAQTVVSAGAYVAEFGTLTVGNRIFVKITPVNAEAWTGTPTILNTIIEAA